MLTLDALRAELAERGLRWETGETGISIPPQTHGADAFLGVVLDEDALLADIARAEDAPAAGETAGAAPPPSIDWRRANGGRNFVTSIKAQRQCGACVAFAVVAAIESRLAIASGTADPRTDLSEAHLYFCGGRVCQGAGAGWWPSKALDFAETKGLGREADFAYQPQTLQCRQISTQRLLDPHTTQTSFAARKREIATAGPVIGVLRVFEDFTFYNGGVYKHAAGEYLGLHAVAVIGYDDVGRAWIIKNSWATNWGQSGFGLIGYGECGFDAEWPFFAPQLQGAAVASSGAFYNAS